MSDESDYESEVSFLTSNLLFESEANEFPAAPMSNTHDEQQFLYDEDYQKLICTGIDFDDIPLNILHDYSLKTKILDLSGNNFRSLSSIENFPNLEELILDDNRLDDHQTIFPKLLYLHTLMMNKNRFEDIIRLADQLRQAYPSLTHLSLLGNKACPYRINASEQPTSEDQHDLDEEYRRYRHLLIFCLPTLKFLDCREISLNERRMAVKLGDILYSIAETKKNNTAS